MKKLLVTAAVFISVTIFWSCSSASDPEPVPEVVKCDHCQDYTGQGFKGIPVKLAYKMVELYKKDHWDGYTVGTNTVPTDARSVWFSLDSLKKFIWFIEEEVCRNKCVDPKDLGLRFYYGEYPDQETWTSLDGEDDPASMEHKKAYQGLHTVLILPTYYSTSSGMNVDFDPREVSPSKDGKCSPTPLQDVFDKLVEADSSQNASQNPNYNRPIVYVYSADVNTTIKNKGSLIPPPPPSFTNRVGEKNGAVIFDKLEGISYSYGF